MHTETDNDDEPVGRVLSRREVLTLFGAAGATLLVGCAAPPTAEPTGAIVATSAPAPTLAPAVTAAPVATGVPAPTIASLPACVVLPDLTEGPYFVDTQLNRSDIRADTTTGVVQAGAPLLLTFRVQQVQDGACVPLAGATVDIWHTDAAGVYSGVTDRSFSTVGQDFLRGSQTTDPAGIARFTTIYPGWYNGRAVHIHFKIHNAVGSQTAEFASQVFFDESFTDMVYTSAPYNTRGARTRRNEQDGIFNQSEGKLTLDVASTSDGYESIFDIALT